VIIHRRIRAALIPVLLLLTASACAFNPSNYAIPGTGVGGGTYTINIQFASVLNLPPGANVSSNGAKVGTLQSVHLHSYGVTAVTKVKKSVKLPANTRAELRQTTILGDIYIALIVPVDASSVQMIDDGGTIPLAQTDPGPQVEDVLRRLSNFISGGSIQELQNSMDRLNAALPVDSRETKDLASQAAKDLSGAANGIDNIDRILHSSSDVTDRLMRQLPNLRQIFSDDGNYRLEQTSVIGNSVFSITVRLQQLTNALLWLLPRLPSINGFLDKVVPLVRTPSDSALQFNGNIGSLISLFRGKLIPFVAQGPAINVTSLQVDGKNATPDVMAVLRIIGAAQ